jgi:thymidylate synthase
MNEYFELIKKIMFFGDNVNSRGFSTKELICESIEINDYNFYSIPKVREFDKIYKYFIGELCWYFSGNNHVSGILPYSKFWNKIKNDDDTVNSNYGYSIFYKKNDYNKTQFEWVLNQLKKDQFSRQAILQYNNQNNCFDFNKDFVCTQVQQFFIRNNQLISIVYIRSSDVIKGLTFDIPFWSIVQQQLVLLLKNSYPNIKCGALKINFGSVHIYELDFELINKMLDSIEKKQHHIKLLKAIPVLQSLDQPWYENNINEFIECK